MPGRMEIISNPNSKNIIVDYAHSPDAYEKIFSTIKNITNKKIIYFALEEIVQIAP